MDVNTNFDIRNLRPEDARPARNPFTGKSAFVTGGGSGIGRAAALALAAGGCSVTVAGRTEQTLMETVREIEDAGGRADYAICDVADEHVVATAIASTVAKWGRLDFEVNSAGVDGEDPEPTADYPMDKFDRMMATNVRGVFLSMKHELLQMQVQGSGVIVNISSGTGLVGVPGFAAYSASKWAEIGMTKSAALEYAKRGIRINAICPGLVDTPLFANTAAAHQQEADRLIEAHPIGRIAKAAEIADAIVWLCSDQSSYLLGAALPLDGGYTAQ